MKDLISLADLSEQEVRRILVRAREIETMHKQGVRHLTYVQCYSTLVLALLSSATLRCPSV